MSMFSAFAFRFGILLFFCTCLHNLVYSWLCIVFRVRILKFALLADPWNKYIFKKQINHTELVLGWFPFSSYIKPFGMSVENTEIDTLLPQERAVSFTHKAKYQRRIMKAAPYCLWPFLVILFLFLSNARAPFIENISIVGKFLYQASLALFGVTPKDEFRSYATAAMEQMQLLPFSLLIAMVTIGIGGLGNAITEYLSNLKKHKILLFITCVICLAIYYLILWKIPAFVFSFFTVLQILRYSISIIFGIYVASFCFYAIMISVLKLNNAR